MTNKHEALIFADDRLRSHGDDIYEWAIDAEDWIRRLHAELETLRTGYAAARLEIESLRAAQPAGAQQPGAAYAALSDVDSLAQEIRRVDGAHRLGAGALAEALMPFLRASHGQAPADAKALAEADRRAGEAERILATCKENVMRFEQVRSRMKYQWGADQRVSFDEVWDEALALKKAAQAAPTTQPSPAAQGDALDAEVLRDAERYRFIRDVPYSDDVRSVLVHQQNAAMDRIIDAARAAQEGKSHDN